MNKKKSEETGLTISPKSSETRWAALNNNYEIIAEGKTPEEAIAKAKKIANDFILTFIPAKDLTYIL